MKFRGKVTTSGKTILLLVKPYFYKERIIFTVYMLKDLTNWKENR